MLDKITKPLKILSTLGLVVAGYTLDSGPCQADWYTCWSSNSCCKGWMSEQNAEAACRQWPGTTGYNASSYHSSIDFCRDHQGC